MRTKLPGKLDVNFINKIFFKSISPNKINHGQCFIWAYIAFHLYKNVKLHDMESHAFVKYEHKFYDSERSKGEYDWRDLPATNFGNGYSKIPVPMSPVSEDEFKKRWNEFLTYYNESWESLNEKVAYVIQRQTRLL